MNDPSPITAISPLRQRLIDDMNMRRFSRATQHSYIRDVGRFATFLGRSPDTATVDDVRRFQIEQCDAGVPTPIPACRCSSPLDPGWPRSRMAERRRC
jgi:integrase/recombinase XerD